MSPKSSFGKQPRSGYAITPNNAQDPEKSSNYETEAGKYEDHGGGFGGDDDSDSDYEDEYDQTPNAPQYTPGEELRYQQHMQAIAEDLRREKLTLW